MITGFLVDVMAISVAPFCCGRAVNYVVGYTKAYRPASAPSVADGWMLPASMVILTVFFGKRKQK
jgi:hypothetical protein